MGAAHRGSLGLVAFRISDDGLRREATSGQSPVAKPVAATDTATDDSHTGRTFLLWPTPGHFYCGLTQNPRQPLFSDGHVLYCPTDGAPALLPSSPLVLPMERTLDGFRAASDVSRGPRTGCHTGHRAHRAQAAVDVPPVQAADGLGGHRGGGSSVGPPPRPGNSCDGVSVPFNRDNAGERPFQLQQASHATGAAVGSDGNQVH